MNEALAALVPALVVFGSTAVVIALVVWVVRRARRGPRARAAAEAQRAGAGTALVALDDAVAELDLEVGLSGALYGGEDAAGLRRARMSAQHARDEAFQEYRDISGARRAPAGRRTHGRAHPQPARRRPSPRSRPRAPPMRSG